jgi:hypothetical protein
MILSNTFEYQRFKVNIYRIYINIYSVYGYIVSYLLNRPK